MPKPWGPTSDPEEANLERMRSLNRADAYARLQETLPPHILSAVIKLDDILAECGNRELMDSGTVADGLLDVRILLTNPDQSQAEPAGAQA